MQATEKIAGLDGIELKYLAVKTADKYDSAVIWLHGLGADRNDFAPVVPELKLPAELKPLFIFPDAPVMPVTINGGMAMRAWYDIALADLKKEIDLKGLEKSCKQVLEISKKLEELGVPASRQILAGFSQGGVVSLQLGLRREPAFAGIIALSAYLVDGVPDAQDNSPQLLIAHGQHDEVVPYSEGVRAHSETSKKNYRSELKTYPIGHTVSGYEIADISAFIQKCLKPE